MRILSSGVPQGRSSASDAKIQDVPIFAGEILQFAFSSGVINVLGLTGPLFMLQVYDRVLTSRSLPTLVGLSVLALGLYAAQAILDTLRSRVLLRVGERFDELLSRRVHNAILALPLAGATATNGTQPLRDLDNVRGFLSGQGPTALSDLPWVPFYLGLCFLFHFWIGVTALSGALLLAALTIVADTVSRKHTQEISNHGTTRTSLLEASRRNAEVIRAMGLEEVSWQRWQSANGTYIAAGRRVGDLTSALTNLSRMLRLALQSAILAVGAWLVIAEEVTPGVMIASSIMMGRAFAPVDLAIANWRPFVTARQSWARLKDVFKAVFERSHAMALPKPERELRVDGVMIIPPGGKKPSVSGVSFSLPAGSALGIIGSSGSGKSTLVRALVGVWRPAAGRVLLDDASLDQWGRDVIGRHIGYLPQAVELFAGTVAENIARFQPEADPEAIIKAAKAAGVHHLILALEHGYQTHIGEAGAALSAGQSQRIGLARALYGDPFFVVLDEPNAHLDAEGEAALIEAIGRVRQRLGVVVVVAHRPRVLNAVDLVLRLDGGRARAFGSRDDVLRPPHPSSRNVVTLDGNERGRRTRSQTRIQAETSDV